jgi:hypothetical protein
MSARGVYRDFFLLWYNAMQSAEIQVMFRENIGWLNPLEPSGYYMYHQP